MTKSPMSHPRSFSTEVSFPVRLGFRGGESRTCRGVTSGKKCAHFQKFPGQFYLSITYSLYR